MAGRFTLNLYKFDEGDKIQKFFFKPTQSDSIQICNDLKHFFQMVFDENRFLKSIIILEADTLKETIVIDMD